jgi:hypothetical protein
MFVDDQAVYLAGVPVHDELVLELAKLIDDPALAERLEESYGRMVKVLALTIPERVTIIRALDDAPPRVAGLHDSAVIPAGVCLEPFRRRRRRSCGSRGGRHRVWGKLSSSG